MDSTHSMESTSNILLCVFHVHSTSILCGFHVECGIFMDWPHRILHLVDMTVTPVTYHSLPPPLPPCCSQHHNNTTITSRTWSRERNGNRCTVTFFSFFFTDILFFLPLHTPWAVSNETDPFHPPDIACSTCHLPILPPCQFCPVSPPCCLIHLPCIHFHPPCLFLLYMLLHTTMPKATQPGQPDNKQWCDDKEKGYTHTLAKVLDP